MGIQPSLRPFSQASLVGGLRSPPTYSSRSPAMRALEDEVVHLRDADVNVLILGETGTGKSFLARRIHASSERAARPFVDINCAGLAPDFVQSELFGHERGAFTGAYATTTGLLDAANAGTLFLDEIGDMDIRIQPKLLKVLEEKRFRRIGDHRERHVDVRLIAATHCDLLGAIERGAFRADLFYRVSTVTLTMPSLRDRREDIIDIAEAMLRAMGRHRRELSRGASERLLDYHWPGNLRELKSVLERASLRCRSEVLSADDLGLTAARTVVAPASPKPERKEPPASSRLLVEGASGARREDVEREHIRLALEAEDGRVQRAARRLGIARSTLYAKLRLYAIRPAEIRQSTSRIKVAAIAETEDDEVDDPRLGSVG